MMQHISRFMSGIFSPLLTPSYGVFLALWVSILCYQQLGTRLVVMLMIFGITCVIPMIAIGLLHNFKLIEDRSLDERKERHLPYIIAILCHTAATIYLVNVHAPSWLVAFMGGVILTCTISLFVNIWWKISAHCAGTGGLLALLFFLHSEGLEAFDLFWLICIAIIICGVVGSARIYEERHTFWQVAAGFINGYYSVKILMNIFA